MEVKKLWMAVLISALILTYGAVGKAVAEDVQFKVALVNPLEVVGRTTLGKEAGTKIDALIEEGTAKIQKDQQELDKLMAEITKKSSVWSNEVRQEKERAYNKKKNEIAIKKEDVQFELQQLQKKLLEPIFKELDVVLPEVASKNGYSMIFDKFRVAELRLVVFADDAIDITVLVSEELEKRLTAKKAN